MLFMSDSDSIYRTLYPLAGYLIGQAICFLLGYDLLCIEAVNLCKFTSLFELFLHFQALARLRFSETVAQSDVDEALRLMQMSKFSLYSDDRQKSGLDPISDIYCIIRDEAARTNRMDVSYAHALNWISRKVCFEIWACAIHNS